MRRPDFTRRVAVTGLGIISPVGSDIPTAWANLVAGNTGLKRITRWDPEVTSCHAAGEVNDFEPKDWMDFKALRRTDKNVVFGVASAKQALADSGLEITPDNAEDVGVIFGSGVGGPGLMAEAIDTLKTRGPKSVSPFFIANMLPDTASGQIAIELGAKGPNMCIVTACSTGTHNIGEAAEGIRRGDYVAAICGSTETPLYEVGYVGFSNMRGMGTPRQGRPLEDISRPFDRSRNGFVLGEGSGAMIVEDLEHARARGATVYAEVVGYGNAADAWDLIQPVDKGDGVRRAMEMALQRHGVPRDEIDLINPHGTSTPLGDLREAEAIKAVFPDRYREVAISGTKSMTGHLMGAAGAIEAVFTVLSVHHQVAPATQNYLEPDPEIDLDVVHGESRPMEIRYAMSDNIGLGGHNGAVIFKRYRGD
ncbi:MAG TPA: beta-ketoacyl-ACP synthase II [Candidatus Limnocylindrales bacterium]|nr:beta-ketoacyl-ACP synthase II [Candidatus Limnocylindrales bacterium]